MNQDTDSIWDWIQIRLPTQMEHIMMNQDTDSIWDRILIRLPTQLEHIIMNQDTDPILDRIRILVPTQMEHIMMNQDMDSIWDRIRILLPNIDGAYHDEPRHGSNQGPDQLQLPPPTHSDNVLCCMSHNPIKHCGDAKTIVACPALLGQIWTRLTMLTSLCNFAE